MIGGHRAVFLYNASYGGGSGELWAIEGEEAQYTLQGPAQPYVQGRCVRVASDRIWFDTGTEVQVIRRSDIGRYDRHHLVKWEPPQPERNGYAEWERSIRNI